jgi:hypothetical protein
VADSLAGKVKGPVIVRISNVRVELRFLRALSVPPGKTVSAANGFSGTASKSKANTESTFRRDNRLILVSPCLVSWTGNPIIARPSTSHYPKLNSIKIELLDKEH